MSPSHREQLDEFEYDSEPLDVDAHMEAYDKAMSVINLREIAQGIRKQVGGDHYAKHSIQPWSIIDDWNLDYYLGNVIKYTLREKSNKVEDLKKAIHYLEKKIELLDA